MRSLRRVLRWRADCDVIRRVMAKRRSRLRMVPVALLALGIAAALLYALGPRTAIDTTIIFDPMLIGEDLDAYLADSEAAYADIRVDVHKQIVWADPETRERTPLSIVYIHGFSASPGEMRPLPDMVAGHFGANLFLTRLAGHGRGGDAMAEASVNDWINDLAEAIAVARLLGERIVLMGTSTGATLIVWGAAQPALMENVAALALISPNFGVNARGFGLLTLPWGSAIAERVIGERYGFRTLNALHARYWTSDYPTRALMPMAALVELARSTEIHNIQIPALFIYSPHDAVVRTDRTEEIIARWGAAVEVEHIAESGDPLNHVIAGEALSPETTSAVAQIITRHLLQFLGHRGDQPSDFESREKR